MNYGWITKAKKLDKISEPRTMYFFFFNEFIYLFIYFCVTREVQDYVFQKQVSEAKSCKLRRIQNQEDYAFAD